MKRLKSVFYISLLFVVTSLPHSETIAQKDGSPLELNQNSTVQETLGYLNKTIFPSARIGVWSWLPGDEQVWEAETGYYTPKWLHYFVEYPSFSESGRWSRGCLMLGNVLKTASRGVSKLQS